MDKIKEFFNKIVERLKDLFTNDFGRHQLCLTVYTLVFGTLCGLILGTSLSVFLMLLFALVAEFCYCFVPTKFVTLRGTEIKVPDFKAFFANRSECLIKPKHEFKFRNFYYAFVSIIAFVILRFLF